MGDRGAAEIGAGAVARLVRAVGARPASAAAAATAVVSGLALAVPGVDLAVAGLFRGDHGGFPAAQVPILVDLRLAGMAVTRIAVVTLVLGLLGKLLLPLLMRGVPIRVLLFLATSLTLGPGLLVNVLLKEYWGRPRPWQVVDLGGTMAFFPAWVPGGACASNCSFPSGEASSAAWLLAFVFVVPERWRRPVAAVALAWVAAISLNRMAFGGHFLSDVLIGWGLTATVVLLCRRLVLEGTGPEWAARIDAGLALAGARGLSALRAGIGAGLAVAARLGPRG